jgi:hypothetical protein
MKHSGQRRPGGADRRSPSASGSRSSPPSPRLVRRGGAAIAFGIYIGGDLRGGAAIRHRGRSPDPPPPPDDGSAAADQTDQERSEPAGPRTAPRRRLSPTGVAAPATTRWLSRRCDLLIRLTSLDAEAVRAST